MLNDGKVAAGLRADMGMDIESGWRRCVAAESGLKCEDILIQEQRVDNTSYVLAQPASPSGARDQFLLTRIMFDINLRLDADRRLFVQFRDAHAPGTRLDRDPIAQSNPMEDIWDVRQAYFEWIGNIDRLGTFLPRKFCENNRHGKTRIRLLSSDSLWIVSSAHSLSFFDPESGAYFKQRFS
jgi:hypothetical protein